MAGQDTVISIRDLGIVSEAGARVIDGVSLDVARGEVLALIGASGSGKTTLALTALGHLRPGLIHDRGQVVLDGDDVFALTQNQLNNLRGRKVAYVAQSAAAAFNPRLRLDDQVIESARLHATLGPEKAKLRARELFRYLSLPHPETIGRRYPYQVSGGQLQRFMIAMGLLEKPLLLVCDEPTSALDVTTQVEVMRLLKGAIADNRTSALFVSHDLAVVAQIASRIAVLKGGRLIECGPTEQIINDPREAYTKELIAASSHLRGGTAGKCAPRAGLSEGLQARAIVAGYGRMESGKPQFPSLHDVDLEVGRSEIVAVIGESGSGKTTLARVIAGLHAPTSGALTLSGKPLAALDRQRSLDDRRRVQLVFQMADTALNPRHKVRRIIGRTLKFFHGMSGSAAEARMVELLAKVQLPAHYLDRYPTEISGGEKQRVNLARALAAEPDVLICDEITAALDTIVAQTVIALVRKLRDELGLAIIFISHDLATVANLADRVMVLRHGRVVETGPTGDVLNSPRDPYTRLLTASVPELRLGWLEDAASTRDDLAAALKQSTPAAIPA